MRMMIKDVRLAFPQIFTPKAFNDDGEPAYSAALIIDPKVSKAYVIEEAGMLTPIKITEALERVAKDQWGAKAGTVLDDLTAKGRVCFVAGPKTDSSGQPYAGFEGAYHMSTRGKTRPLCLNRDKTPVAEQDGVIYAGCYVNASVELWTQDNKWGKRINASLRGVHFVRDGDAFTGGAPASPDEFPDLDVGTPGGSLV